MNIKKIFTVLSITLLMSFVYSNEPNSNKTEMESNQEPRVTIHADDTHLPSILELLAKQSNYNIVTGPSVQSKQKISIHLDDVPVSEAINLIIRASGLSYELIGSSILVANSSKLNSDVGVKPHIIKLQYANAEEIALLLSNITETITIDKTGNNILVTASPKKINEIERIVKEIDVPAVQIMLEARLIEVSLNDREEMGIDWERLASTSFILAESGEPQQINNNLQAGSVLPGYDWEIIEGGDVTTSADDFIYETIEDLTLGQLPEGLGFTRASEVRPFGRQLTAFDITIDALVKDNSANILTNTQVVTLNGHQATIDMVDEIPYVAQSGGSTGNMQVKKEVVGIRLHILPTVNSDGYITTEITPEVSSIVDWTAMGYPWTKKRKSTTTIRVQDGETIIIAGLITTEKLLTESKFPLLWRLPWIGKALFTHTLEEDKQTNLIIQVRPTIVQDNYSGIIKTPAHEAAEALLENTINGVNSDDKKNNDNITTTK